VENQERFSIMLVNDDLASSFLTTCQAEETDWFHPPLVYTNAEEALRYVLGNCLSPDPAKRLPFPQILLIDINMPVKDGFEFVEELLKICPDLKQRTTLCFLTVSDHPRDKGKAEELGVECYFTQPLKDSDFLLMRQVAKNKVLPMARANQR
jgi:CheY-like chemotaxis protein